MYIKGCKEDDVQLDLDEQSVSLRVTEPSPATELLLSPLFSSVDTTNSGLRVLSTKIEVALQKDVPGVRWPSLLAQENAPQAAVSSVSSVSTSNTAPSAASKRSKWDSFKDEDGDAAQAEGDAGVDAFFKKLYADADDDTRRAMMKSYQESGGTSLSTNWADVSKGKVETRPPDGMEARKW